LSMGRWIWSVLRPIFEIKKPREGLLIPEALKVFNVA